MENQEAKTISEYQNIFFLISTMINLEFIKYGPKNIFYKYLKK